jgi:hypothetical protein
LLGREHPQRRELQFAARNIPQIARHDGIGLCGHCQLDQVVVGFVRQIRPPSLEHVDPATAVHQAIEHLATFLGRQHGVGEQLGAARNVFVLGQQCRPEHGLVPTLSTCSKYGSASATATQERRDQHMGVQHDRQHNPNHD